MHDFFFEAAHRRALTYGRAVIVENIDERGAFTPRHERYDFLVGYTQKNS